MTKITTTHILPRSWTAKAPEKHNGWKTFPASFWGPLQLPLFRFFFSPRKFNFRGGNLRLGLRQFLWSKKKKRWTPFRYLGFDGDDFTMVKNPLKKKNNLKKYSQLAISDPEIKPFERLIFPTKYVIPKSLSRLAIGQVSFLAKKSKEMIQKNQSMFSCQFKGKYNFWKQRGPMLAWKVRLSLDIWQEPPFVKYRL